MSEALVNQLAQTGVLGAVLVWFMLRMETIIKANTDAINQMRIAFLTRGDKDGV